MIYNVSTLYPCKSIFFAEECPEKNNIFYKMSTKSFRFAKKETYSFVPNLQLPKRELKVEQEY